MVFLAISLGPCHACARRGVRGTTSSALSSASRARPAATLFPSGRRVRRGGQHGVAIDPRQAERRPCGLGSDAYRLPWSETVPPVGFEPTTIGLKVWSRSFSRVGGMALNWGNAVGRAVACRPVSGRQAADGSGFGSAFDCSCACRRGVGRRQVVSRLRRTLGNGTTESARRFQGSSWSWIATPSDGGALVAGDAEHTIRADTGRWGRSSHRARPVASPLLGRGVASGDGWRWWSRLGDGLRHNQRRLPRRPVSNLGRPSSDVPDRSHRARWWRLHAH